MIANATPIQLDAVRIRHNEHVVLEDVTTRVLPGNWSIYWKTVRKPASSNLVRRSGHGFRSWIGLWH